MMRKLVFLALALPAWALQQSPCPCIPRDECPRDYGKSATDVRELGFIDPCEEYGTVRCCGVTVSIKLKDDSEDFRAMEDLYTAESTVSYNYAQNLKPRRRNPEGKLVENPEEVKAPEVITWKLEDGGQNPAEIPKPGQFERARAKYLKPSLKTATLPKQFEKTSTALKGIAGSRRKEETSTEQPVQEIKYPEPTPENSSTSFAQLNKGGQMRVPPIVPKIKPFNLRRSQIGTSLFKRPAVDRPEESQPASDLPPVEEIPLKVTLRPFVRRRRPLSPRPTQPVEVEGEKNEENPALVSQTVVSVEQNTQEAQPDQFLPLSPIKTEGGRRLRKRIRPKLVNGVNGNFQSPLEDLKMDNSPSSPTGSGGTPAGNYEETPKPIEIPLENVKQPEEAIEPPQEETSPVIKTKTEEEKPILIKTPTEEPPEMEKPSPMSVQQMTYAQPPLRIRISPNFSTDFPPAPLFKEENMDVGKLIRTRPILLAENLPLPKQIPVRLSSQYSRIRQDNNEEVTEERKPSRRFKIPAQLLRSTTPASEEPETYDVVLDQKSRQPPRNRNYPIRGDDYTREEGQSENVEESQIHQSYAPEERKRPLRLRLKPKYEGFEGNRPTNPSGIEYTEKVGQTGGRVASTTPTSAESSTAKFVFPPFRKPIERKKESVKLEFKYSNKEENEETTPRALRYQIPPTQGDPPTQTTPQVFQPATLQTLSVTVPKSKYTRFSVPNKFDFSVKGSEGTSFVLSSPFVPTTTPRPARIKFPESDPQQNFPDKIMTEVHQSENGTEIRITQKMRESERERPEESSTPSREQNRPMTHIRFSSFEQDVSAMKLNEEKTPELKPTEKTIPQLPQVVEVEKIPPYQFNQPINEDKEKEGAKFQRPNFEEQNFQNTKIERPKIEGSHFDRSKFEGSHFDRSKFETLGNPGSAQDSKLEGSQFEVPKVEKWVHPEVKFNFSSFSPSFPSQESRGEWKEQKPLSSPSPQFDNQRPTVLKNERPKEFRPFEERPQQFNYGGYKETPTVQFQPPRPSHYPGATNDNKQRPSRFPVSDIKKFIDRPKNPEENYRQQVKPLKLGLSPDGPIGGGRPQFPQQYYQMKPNGFQQGFQQHLQIQNQILGRLRTNPRTSRAANLTSLDHNELRLANLTRNDTKVKELEKSLMAKIEQARKEVKSPEEFLAAPHIVKGRVKQKQGGVFSPPNKIIRGFVPILPYSEKDPGPIFVKVNSLPMKV